MERQENGTPLRKLAAASAVMALATLAAADLSAQSGDPLDICRAPLIQDLLAENSSETAHALAILLMTREEYESRSAGGSADIDIYSGSYEEAQSKARKDLNFQKTVTSTSEAYSGASSTMPKEAFRSFDNCIDKLSGTAHLRTRVVHASPSGAAVSVTWVPARGFEQPLQDVKIELLPKNAQSREPVSTIGPGDRTILIDVGEDFRQPLFGSVSGKSGNLRLKSDFFIPAQVHDTPSTLTPSPFYLTRDGKIVGTPDALAWRAGGSYWRRNGKAYYDGEISPNSFALHPHADRPATVSFEVPPLATTFSSGIAFDDHVKETGGAIGERGCHRGEVRLSIKFDSRVVWSRVLVGAAWSPSSTSDLEAGKYKGAIFADDIPVPRAAREIELSVTPLGDYENMDGCIVWVKPRFL